MKVTKTEPEVQVIKPGGIAIELTIEEAEALASLVAMVVDNENFRSSTLFSQLRQVGIENNKYEIEAGNKGIVSWLGVVPSRW